MSSNRYRRAVKDFAQSNAEYIENLSQRMGDSAVCINPMVGEWHKDAGFLLQLAMAIALDKPLFLLVPEGMILPEKIQRVADGIERFKLGDNDSLWAAAEKLLASARAKGFPG